MTKRDCAVRYVVETLRDVPAVTPLETTHEGQPRTALVFFLRFKKSTRIALNGNKHHYVRLFILRQFFNDLSKLLGFRKARKLQRFCDADL